MLARWDRRKVVRRRISSSIPRPQARSLTEPTPLRPPTSAPEPSPGQSFLLAGRGAVGLVLRPRSRSRLGRPSLCLPCCSGQLAATPCL